jgi:PTH1 family peptidyl-tRNA hydrolase
MTEDKPCIVVGLGNPGERYARTRHNAGFMAVDLLARDAGTGEWRRERRSLVCRASLEGRAAVLAKPLTFMNLSGLAVEELRESQEAGPEDFIVVLDDTSLEFGRIRIRRRGSAGGHHGLESVIRSLRTDEFIRIRLGIGEEDMPEERAGFVLSDFPRSLEEAVAEMVGRAGEAVRSILRDGVEKAMSACNAGMEPRRILS